MLWDFPTILIHKVKDNNSNTDKNTKAKMLWDFPTILMLKQLCANVDNIKNLTWHVDGRKCEG